MLANVVLAQRTERSEKLRPKIAAYHRDRYSKQVNSFDAHLQSLKEFEELPPYSRQKAWHTKVALEAYHFSFDRMGLIPNEANIVARGLWLFMRGETVSGKTIRRWLVRERIGGGPGRAPIKAYADALSVPHRRKPPQQSEI
jgi:hypothetical protein